MTLDETYAYKGIKYTRLANYDNDQADNKDTMIISGSYKPGQSKKNVRNDEDVKTWTAVSAAPSLTEELKLVFFRANLATAPLLNTGCNCYLEVKYIVQFKDLKENYRYPQAGQAAITQSAPGDIVQVA
jgi:hypothetical protein